MPDDANPWNTLNFSAGLSHMSWFPNPPGGGLAAEAYLELFLRWLGWANQGQWHAWASLVFTLGVPTIPTTFIPGFTRLIVTLDNRIGDIDAYGALVTFYWYDPSDPGDVLYAATHEGSHARFVPIAGHAVPTHYIAPGEYQEGDSTLTNLCLKIREYTDWRGRTRHEPPYLAGHYVMQPEGLGPPVFVLDTPPTIVMRYLDGGPMGNFATVAMGAYWGLGTNARAGGERYGNWDIFTTDSLCLRIWMTSIGANFNNPEELPIIENFDPSRGGAATFPDPPYVDYVLALRTKGWYYIVGDAGMVAIFSLTGGTEVGDFFAAQSSLIYGTVRMPAHNVSVPGGIGEGAFLPYVRGFLFLRTGDFSAVTHWHDRTFTATNLHLDGTAVWGQYYYPPEPPISSSQPDEGVAPAMPKVWNYSRLIGPDGKPVSVPYVLAATITNEVVNDMAPGEMRLIGWRDNTVVVSDDLGRHNRLFWNGCFAIVLSNWSENGIGEIGLPAVSSTVYLLTGLINDPLGGPIQNWAEYLYWFSATEAVYVEIPSAWGSDPDVYWTSPDMVGLPARYTWDPVAHTISAPAYSEADQITERLEGLLFEQTKVIGTGANATAQSRFLRVTIRVSAYIHLIGGDNPSCMAEVGSSLNYLIEAVDTTVPGGNLSNFPPLTWTFDTSQYPESGDYKAEYDASLLDLPPDHYPTPAPSQSSTYFQGRPCYEDIGSYAIPFTVTDSGGRQISAHTLYLTVVPRAGPMITTHRHLPAATAGSAYMLAMSATGGTAPYSWAAFTDLPTGMMLSALGVLSGTPTTAGDYHFTVVGTDATGELTNVVEFLLTVN